MAVILRTLHHFGTPDTEIKKPILFVDSVNVDSYNAEMHNICVRYIRENTPHVANPTLEHVAFKRENLLAKDEKDVYCNKKDGYSYVADEKKHIFTMYKKKTNVGYVFTTVTIEKIFTLTHGECKRVVPQVTKKTSLFDDFSSELKSRVVEYRDRTIGQK